MFFAGFENMEDIISQFEIEESELDGVRIIIAVYEGGYEGEAFIVFAKEDKFFEVHASHCSCYGLEGQWNPEETTPEALKFRLDNAHVPMIAAYGEAGVRALERGLLDYVFDREVLSN